MSVVFYEKGLTELLASSFGPVGRYVTAKAEEAAEYARTNVRSNFNTRTGALAQSIGAFPVETDRGPGWSVGTGSGENERGIPVGVYGRILELGGEPHDIYRVKAPYLWSEADNPDPLILEAVSVHHPGPVARPWLVPAFYQAGFVDA